VRYFSGGDFLPDPFYRKRFWYQCALIEFRYFREDAETLARNAIATIPRAVPLLRAQSFLAESSDEFSIQFWFGKHPTGRFYFDKSSNKQPATEDGAYLVYSIGPTGAVAVFLHAARSEVMEATERFVLRHIGPLSWGRVARTASCSAPYAECAVRGLYLIGAFALRAGNKPKRAACRFYRNATGRFTRVIDELIETDARFWTDAQITVIMESQIRHASVTSVNKFFGINRAAT
jgi:hypothetical protein